MKLSYNCTMDFSEIEHEQVKAEPSQGLTLEEILIKQEQEDSELISKHQIEDFHVQNVKREIHSEIEIKEEHSEESAVKDDCNGINKNAHSRTPTFIPAKSSDRYLRQYQNFCDWRKTNGITGVNQRVMLAFFEDFYKTVKSSCLWSYYSMLRSCLLIYEKVDIKSYGELLQYLKRKSTRCKVKKSVVLTNEHITTFLENAPDDTHLLLKVILVLGVFGGCCREELINIKTQDVEDCGGYIKVKILPAKTGASRSFVVPDMDGFPYCFIIRKYQSLRPGNATSDRFLLGYRNKKCTGQVVGIHTVGNAPKNIAQYLGLPNPSDYTGHCFRRSSASLLAEGGGNLGVMMMNPAGWKSVNVGQACSEQSAKLETENRLMEYSSVNGTSTPNSSKTDTSLRNGTKDVNTCTTKEKERILSYIKCNNSNCTFIFYLSKEKNR